MLLESLHEDLYAWKLQRWNKYPSTHMIITLIAYAGFLIPAWDASQVLIANDVCS